MDRPLTALGLMSGTSLDGIDAALIRTDGEAVVDTGPAITVPYEASLRNRLRGILGGRGPVAAVARELTVAHARAVEAFLEEAKLPPSRVDVIGFHGHTILHRPRAGRTWQIGDGDLLARLTGIDVIDDFRSSDVAGGGEGAPLAPLYHAALSRGFEGPLAVLNIGGVANVTWIGARGELVAFDTGPGNALIDDWVGAQAGRAYDEDGALARAGHVDRDVLAVLLDDPYFDRPPPKSLDRDDFDLAPLAGLSSAAGAATLTVFTAAAVALAERHFPAPVRRWLVTGGGRRNPALMAALDEALGEQVAPAEAVGWDGGALEAQAFAYLAVRALKRLPLTLPATTGVSRPMPGGRLHKPPARPPGSA